jgi:hypothetical protein
MKRVVPEFFRRWGDYSDPLVLMFERLYNENPGMFPKMFRKMKETGVSLGGFSEPYLSHVLYYFMFHGAGRQLGNYFVPPMPPINPSRLEELEARFNLGVI